jgi:hypothetical protein
MNPLLPCTPVIARGLQWEVVEWDPAGAQQRFRLRCVQGALRGQELDLLAPFETIEPLSKALEPTKAGLLRAWRLYHQAFLLEQALGPDALLAVQPGRLDPAPYQRVPVMRAIRMSRPRLLLADGVGLGKTVQAGLVLTELLARRRAHRILIVSPAGPLLNQWREEMHRRFGLRFQAISDWGALEEKRRELLLGANPFDALALCLLSLDFAKQEKVLQDLERATWDVVVIDEAHRCIRMGTASDREDSQRRRLAEVLARQSDALLLLTATPHDGYDAHFASLMELLDPSLVDRRGALRGPAYRPHVIRRLKRHLNATLAGDQWQFHEREVLPRRVPVVVPTHPHFATFQTALLAVLAPGLRQAVRKKRYGEVLAFVSLLKRSVSTVQACRHTLDVIAHRYAELECIGQEQQDTRRQRLKTLRDYRRRLERYGVLSYEEEQRFGSEDRIILVSTDATAEGLNLHRRCHHLIHIELPYNPNRLEQRNSRIDRYGQTRIPRVRHLYLGGTFEERLWWRRVAKYENRRQVLTFMPNTLGLVTQETSSATGRHDPYWDIPLNEALPKPVIDLPLPAAKETPAAPSFFDRQGQGTLFAPSFGPLFENIPHPDDTPSPPHPRAECHATSWNDDTYPLIVRLLDERGVIASADAQDRTGLDAAAVRPYLQRLINDGKATLEGQRRGAKYRKISHA